VLVSAGPARRRDGIFATIYHGQMIAGPHGAISYDAFFVPGILAYGIIATTFVNMALSTSILREQGVLKRMAAHRSRAGLMSPDASAQPS